VPSPRKEWEPVPVTSNAERPLPTWAQVHCNLLCRGLFLRFRSIPTPRSIASDDYGRLLLVGEGQRAESVKIEVCHEALITQWPWLQNTLNAAAADVRALERLMDRAGRWRNAPELERDKYLATGAERELFAEFRERRDPWLFSFAAIATPLATLIGGTA
jgi:hypothetical protein